MKRILTISACLLILIGAGLGWRYYQWIYKPNTTEGTSNVILIPEGSGKDDVIRTLVAQGILINEASFEWVARRMDFGDLSVKTGRYFIEPGMTNYAVMNKLRLGEQDAVDLIINSAHTLEDLSGIIGKQLELDSLSFYQYVLTDVLPSTHLTRENVLSLFIPNTYEVWWNVSSSKLIDRMKYEHNKFWTEERKSAAAKLSLSPVEVYTLASIVESETQAIDERPTIAGVYLNRLERQMPLQADPTIRFALRDSNIRRILYKHLEIESPYNTYLNTGLPPGPIAMPTIRCIDAVLYPDENDYLFFCAKPGYEGRHLFAKTLSAHLVNARAYQSWLDAEGIR